MYLNIEYLNPHLKKLFLHIDDTQCIRISVNMHSSQLQPVHAVYTYVHSFSFAAFPCTDKLIRTPFVYQILKTPHHPYKSPPLTQIEMNASKIAQPAFFLVLLVL